ncbi:MAG: HD domain-containing protein [Candidatus Pacebacteria bacterium]|nr:HD domain-containing protein [Candidatus Paceibacterota bacterium]
MELEIIETPYFQRLRYIKQNATAYLTYPTAVTSRFDHSLGVMHIAGRMISSALELSAPKDIKNFFIKCKGDFGKEYSKLKDEQLKYIIISLVRLLGLLHDIGHLPFSHTGEDAIDFPDFLRLIYREDEHKEIIYLHNQYGLHLHEYNTLKIIESESMRGKFQSVKEDLLGKKFKDKCYIYDLILMTLDPRKRRKFSVFETLVQIVSSNLDADRADFLLRDGTISGAGFGAYDIDRFITTLRLFNRKETKEFLIRPLFTGISAIETMLIERYKLYKWLYFHHYVVFTDMAVEKLIKSMLKAVVIDSDFAERLDIDIKRFHYANFVKDGIFLDDTYIWHKFNKFLYLLENERKIARENSNDLSKGLSLFTINLDVQNIINELNSGQLKSLREQFKDGDILSSNSIKVYTPIELKETWLVIHESDEETEYKVLCVIKKEEDKLCVYDPRYKLIPLEKRDKDIAVSLLRIVLHRRKLGSALWKDTQQYKEVNRDIKSVIRDAFEKKYCKKYPSQSETSFDDEFEERIKEGTFILNYFAEFFPSDKKELINDVEENWLNKTNQDCHLSIQIKRFKPYGDYEIITRKNDLTTLNECSEIVQGLDDAWSKDVHMYLFLFFFDNFTRVATGIKMGQIKKAMIKTFAKSLGSWYKDAKAMKNVLWKTDMLPKETNTQIKDKAKIED